MRRSLCPSQKIINNNKNNVSSNANTNISVDRNNDNNEVIISRLPLFGFLEIPKSLSQQFRIPSGCIISEKNLELRRVKHLGPSKRFTIIRPGDYANALIKHTDQSTGSEGDGDCEGLPTSSATYPPHDPLVLWSDEKNCDNVIQVIAQLASKLRPHQREGVQFLFECTMGRRGFTGQGCILADDMGLGKTLMSITLLWTLLNQGYTSKTSDSAVKKIMIVCPTSLVGNWENELVKWIGDHCPTFAVKSGNFYNFSPHHHDHEHEHNHHHHY